MNNTTLDNLNEIGIKSDLQVLELVNQYKVIIDKFKKQSDVLIGEIGFKRDGVNVADSDRPASSGYGFGLTGFCVSASKMLLESFQLQSFLEFRNAKAKLISIDIKEQYYGYCYNGSQNYWHTAILVQENINGLKYLFVIDVTIRQFGDEFINKDIWDFNVWKAKLRNSKCTHSLTDFDGVEYSIVPKNTLISTHSHNEINDMKFIELKDNLKRNISLVDSDRKIITDFIFNHSERINTELLLGSISSYNIKYFDDVKTVLEKLYYEVNSQPLYSILKFNNKESLTNWTKTFTETLCTPQFINLFYSIDKACKYYDIDINNLSEALNVDNEVYLIMEFEPNSIFYPIIESDLIDGILNYNTYLNVTELRNMGAEIDKNFNTYRCVSSKLY